jgi:hypothetical protein
MDVGCAPSRLIPSNADLIVLFRPYATSACGRMLLVYAALSLNILEDVSCAPFRLIPIHAD